MADSIVIVTQEGERVSVDARFAEFSGLVKSIIEDSGEEEEIPIMKLPKLTLEVMIEYLVHHNYEASPRIPRPLPSASLSQCVSEWDAEFISRFNRDELLSLLTLSDYLQFQDISDLCCATIASWFKGKTIEEIKLQFNQEGDLTREIEDELKTEFPWAVQGVESLPKVQL